MKQVTRVLIALTFTILCSCSSDDEKQNTIEQATEQKGHEAAQRIKAPLDQAEMTKQLQDEHNKKIQETATGD